MTQLKIYKQNLCNIYKIKIDLHVNRKSREVIGKVNEEIEIGGGSYLTAMR